MAIFGYELKKAKPQTKAVSRQIEVPNKLIEALNVRMGNGTFFSPEGKNYVQKAYAYNHLVYSVINRLAVMGASVPWLLYEVQDKGSFNQYKVSSLLSKAEKPINAIRLRNKALKETTHQILSRILEQPNSTMGWNEFMTALLSWKCIDGNAYVYGLSPLTGTDKEKPHELFNMPAYQMVIEGGSPINPVKSYRLESQFSIEFKPNEVLHIKNFNPDYTTTGNWLYGMSPLKAAARAVQASNDNITARAKMYQNMGAMGILADESENVEDSALASEQAINLKAKYKELYGGSNSINEIIVTSGKWKWQNFGLSPVDLALLEAMAVDLRDICSIYRMPSQLFNDGNSTKFNTYSEARKAAWTDAIIPELDQIKDDLNRWLCGAWSKDGKQYYIEPDLMSIIELQDDFGSQVTALKDAEWLTTNEKREFQNYEPLKGAFIDEPLVSAGKIPLSQLGMDTLT
jgi:HK97 family phage portal protein